jgi:signal transduction histidine kinase
LQVEVCDTGPGIAAEDLPHIFEPLFRSRTAPAGVDGSGLGLAIVRLILDQHSAPVSVASPQGKGVCFRFSLPAASPG